MKRYARIFLRLEELIRWGDGTTGRGGLNERILRCDGVLDFLTLILLI